MRTALARNSLAPIVRRLIAVEAALETAVCGTCKGERVEMTAPAGAGHSDDLAEYVPCPACLGSGRPLVAGEGTL